jgi:GGDEF domain-containing protein
MLELAAQEFQHQGLDAISRTMEIEGRTIQVTASIGISVYASDEDATTLVRQAKRARNCYQFYNPL